MDKPVIGIVGRYEISKYDDYLISTNERYREAVIKAGGIPFLILPPQLVVYGKSSPSKLDRLTDEEKDIILKQLKLCDGIITPGGDRIFEYDKYICKYAIDNDMPILGICLGMQIMSFYDKDYNLEKNTEKDLKHSRDKISKAHSVKIDKDSLLYKIIKEEKIVVNSNHNYHCTDVGKYNVVAYSSDKIIEAIEYPNKKFNIGVQWHPDKLILEDDEASIRIFKALINSCKDKNI